MSGNSTKGISSLSSQGASLLDRVDSKPANPTLSETQSEVDHLVSNGMALVSDEKMMASLFGAGLAGRLVRLGTFAASGKTVAPWLLQGASHATALAGESAVFACMERGFAHREGHAPTSSFQKDWARAAINLGSIKLLGGAVRGQNLITQHLLIDTGMVGGHHAGYAVGITDKPHGNLAQQMIQAEGTNLGMKGSLALLHGFSPRLSAMERSLDLSLKSQESNFFSQGQSSPFFSQLMVAGNGGRFSSHSIDSETPKGPEIVKASAKDGEGEGSGKKGSLGKIDPEAADKTGEESEPESIPFTPYQDTPVETKENLISMQRRELRFTVSEERGLVVFKTEYDLHPPIVEGLATEISDHNRYTERPMTSNEAREFQSAIEEAIASREEDHPLKETYGRLRGRLDSLISSEKSGEAIGKTEEESAVERATEVRVHLESRLNHTNPEVRKLTAILLAQHGDPAARPVLEKALDDSDPYVKILVTEVLAHLGDPTARPALENEFSGADQRGKILIITTWGELGDFESRSGLEKALNDPDPAVRKAGAAALEKLKRKQVFVNVREWLNLVNDGNKGPIAESKEKFIIDERDLQAVIHEQLARRNESGKIAPQRLRKMANNFYRGLRNDRLEHLTPYMASRLMGDPTSKGINGVNRATATLHAVLFLPELKAKGWNEVDILRLFDEILELAKRDEEGFQQ